jgi:hypothetical protein
MWKTEGKCMKPGLTSSKPERRWRELKIIRTLADGKQAWARCDAIRADAKIF